MASRERRDKLDQSLLTAALELIERDFKVIPIPLPQKKPIVPNWPHLRIDAKSATEFFGEKGNIGILLGDEHNTVDIDCDCAEAITIARRFLPDTGFLFVRESKPFSHGCTARTEHLRAKNSWTRSIARCSSRLGR